MQKETTAVRQQQIIKATLEIISEKGVNGLTTAELAKRVGFSEAALFRHFPSKIEILKAAMINVNEYLIGEIRLITKKDIGPLTKLEEILKFQLGFFDMNRGVPRILFSDELHIGNKELRQTILKRHKNYVDIIKEVFNEAVSVGVFRTDLDIDMAVRAFFGMIQTTVFSCSLSDFNLSPLEQYEAISRFLRGCFIARSYCV